MFLFLLVLGMSIIHGYNYRLSCSPQGVPSESVRDVSVAVELFFLCLIPFVVCLWHWHYPVQHWVRFGLFLFAFVNVIYLLFQYLGWHFADSEWMREQGFFKQVVIFVRNSEKSYGNAPRFTGLLASPNYLGISLILCWPALLSKMSDFSPNNRVLEWGRRVLLALVALAIVLTYSRSAYLSVFVQFLALCAWFVWRRYYYADTRNELRPVIWQTVCFFGFFLVFLFFLPQAAGRMGAVVDSVDLSIMHRLKVLGVGAELLFESPLCGWGASTFGILYQYLYRIPYETSGFGNMHSAFGMTVYELGLAGCLLGVLAIFGLPDRWHKLPLFVGLAWVGSLVCLVAENPASITSTLFPLLLLLGVSAYSTSDGERGTRGERWGLWIGLVAALLWIIGYTRPLPSLNTMFEKRLQSFITLDGMCENSAYYILDHCTGRSWSHRCDEPMDAGALSKLALAYECVTSSASSDLILEPWMSDNADDVYFSPASSLPRSQALRELLSQNSNRAANALLSATGSWDALSSCVMELTDSPLVMRELFFENRRQYGLSRDYYPLRFNLGASYLVDDRCGAGLCLTARQGVRLLDALLSADAQSSASYASISLRYNTNVGSLARHISDRTASGSSIWRFGGCGSGYRYDVMRVRGGDEHPRKDFTVCAIMPVQYRYAPLEDRSTKAMAQIGWLCWLYLK
ncbi:MAG: O-antigen ligase family protein [Candidatus Sumerlaeales bacterium]|nr:O-antigen ligase family protein [Candidatus Sumerlaeales bacterium]